MSEIKATSMALTLIVCGWLLLLAPPNSLSQTGTANSVKVLSIDGAIGPAVSLYIEAGIAAAHNDGASLIIIEMDTPGGLDLAMRDIIQDILESDIPVVSYVSPRGARAASAGTYILYASHLAAMAPATNLGAATPVQVVAPGDDSPASDDDEEGSDALSGASATERKMINDARAYIRGLAELHGRNAEWAEAAVVDAESLSASEALAANVINIVADNLSDLLQQLDGREVTINGETIVLETANAFIDRHEADWRIKFLTVITDPNLILILGMIGIYGLILEFYNPGFGVPGVIGAICLLLAGYGLQLLPLNYAGLGLILLGIILIAAEALAPSFGIFGLGGIVAFSIGAIILIDTDFGMYQVSLPVVAAVAIGFTALMIVSLRIFMRVRHQGVVTGLQTMIGTSGVSVADFESEGMVKVQGEIWHAHSDTPLKQGDKIKVTGTDGTHLLVSRL